jgi:hypothetical protein
VACAIVIVVIPRPACQPTQLSQATKQQQQRQSEDDLGHDERRRTRKPNSWRPAKRANRFSAKPAQSALFLATVPDPAPFHGGHVIRKALAQPDPAAHDGALAHRLWEESAVSLACGRLT